VRPIAAKHMTCTNWRRRGVDMVELTSASGRARLTTHGAQLLEARLADRDLLWLSPRARLEPGSAIRGGVPICFPWFGKHPDGLPAHGFARNREWRVLHRAADRAVFGLDDDPDTLALWPHRFHAEMAFMLDDAVNFAWTVINTDDKPFRFTYALHSYFGVGDARDCAVDGLDGRSRADGGHVTSQRGAVEFVDPIDAIFEAAPSRLVLRGSDHDLTIDVDGMPSAVLWNPGPNEVADIGDGWRDFVCVERGRVGTAAVILEPGAVHRASMRMGST
jgi:glucose-6-phosphate 1-epimerase